MASRYFHMSMNSALQTILQALAVTIRVENMNSCELANLIVIYLPRSIILQAHKAIRGLYLGKD